MEGVTLHLYGSNSGVAVPGDWEKITHSDAGGYFNFHIIQPWNFTYFTLVADAPAGLGPMEAWSETGRVVAPDTIQWERPPLAVHRNRFIFAKSTPTPTPTPTPSRQWLPVIMFWGQ